LLLVVLFVLSSAARADDEDRRLLCPVISPELARKAAEAVKGGGHCETVCRGCGCKGGPGYRTRADGKRDRCVGYAELISVCGPPPHTACIRECAIVVPACIGRAGGRVWLKELAAGAGLSLTFAPADDRLDAQGEPRKSTPPE
jgi:hypothetical protein